MKLAHSLTVTAVSPQGSDAILLSLGVDGGQRAHVEQEASQPLSPDAVIALGRRLLDEGALAPAAVPTLTETT